MVRIVFKKLILTLIILFLVSCAAIDYRLRGYKRIAFQWGVNIQNVYIDNRRVVEGESYFVNDAIHNISWFENNIEKSYKMLFERSGKYYIDGTRVYLIKNNMQIIDGK